MKKAMFLTVLFFVVFQVNAATLTVCETGCDYTSVKTAVGAAVADDTVEISAGIYQDYNILIDKNLEPLPGTSQWIRAAEFSTHLPQDLR